MTLQELFDKVWNGAKAQGFVRSVADIGVMPNAVCAYRAPSGLKCNAGLVLPDDKYDPAIEKKCVAHPDVWRLFEPIVGAELLPALEELQACHDGAHDAASHEIYLRGFAVRIGLKVPE